ncbi:AAA family ATPase [Pseudogemmobacter faecipullorum]|uniref:AAA family ATPase n=1 Tax=Pseudogemmobacter faecipullorum TaxID=2755041 RepID=A0ABS8CIH5_9RHOB|nr:AAA family ATPase [Pseudogemmobacter faecipullorum]MCB5409199.1 AAA family ATPase [Pseudogemmobacter faecipullorum]
MAPVIALSGAVARGLIGHEILVSRLMIALLAGGHVLIEGPPGLAKTRAVKRLAASLSGGFARIQCTPDLMPADITGTQVFRPASGSFDFLEGPLFHQLVLVDEINRAPPKVQSALLEAMAEGQVTAGGATRILPDPFMVVATQNSIEHEGTFPLPEAQLDRFLLHVALQLPGAAEERAILDLVEAEGQAPPAAPELQLPPEAIRAARAAVAKVWLAPALKDYIVRLVMATRDTAGGPLEGLVDHAVSPRGSLALAAAVRARAALAGRDHGLPEDVTALAVDSLSHRLIPGWRATSEGLSARALIGRLLDHVSPW